MDTRLAPNVRLRFYWLQQMAYVVHEMVSVWIDITDTEERRQYEALVGNACLQLKGQLVPWHWIPQGRIRFPPIRALHSNEKVCDCCARLWAIQAMRKHGSNSKKRLREREDVEVGLLTAEIHPSPSCPHKILTREFRGSYILTEGSLLLDYSLVVYKPPQNGRAGPSRGLRYIGVRLTPGELRVIDLGEANQIEMLSGPLDPVCINAAGGIRGWGGRP